MILGTLLPVLGALGGGCQFTDTRPDRHPAADTSADTSADISAGTSTDTGPTPPDPWEDLAPIALEPLRSFLSTPLSQAQSPARLTSLRDIPFTFVTDDEAGTVWVLDGRYHHDPTTHCVDLSPWPDLDPDGTRVGSCRGGTAEIHRGTLSLEGDLLAIATDPDRQAVWVLSKDGTLSLASADPTGNPLDLLRPLPVSVLTDLGPGPYRLAADGSGGVVMTDGHSLRFIDQAGVEQTRQDAMATELLVSGGTTWLLDDQSLRRWDGSTLQVVAKVDGVGGRLVDGWLSLPAQGRLVELDSLDQASPTTVTVKGLKGPVSSVNGRTWVAVHGGIALVEHGVETVRHAIGPVVDLVVQGTGELAVLDQDATVTVYGDETALGDAAPVNVTLVSYLENPKYTDAKNSPCKGGTNTLDAVLAVAARNRQLLDDLPAPSALGIIPAVAGNVILCGRQYDFPAIWSGDRIATGLFFRTDTELDFSDTSNLEAFLLSQAVGMQTLGIPIRWTRGADRYDGNWPSALKATGISDQILAPDLTIWDDVNAADPRSKDPLPWFASQARTAWRPGADAGAGASARQGGGLLLRPGNSISTFTLAGCANMWIRECKDLKKGGVPLLRADDMDVLALDLFRAIAVRSQDGPDHWSFHLPGLGEYDYTTDCGVVDRHWSGESCQAALLQDFLLDVQARYVENGLVDWWLPQ